MAYTYQDFEQAARQSGYLDKFSQADLDLARKNPQAGMSLLQYKKDYTSATTDEARLAANAGAERVRSSYGGYTGGKDGSGYYLDPLSPSSFTSAPAPTYKSRYDATYSKMLDELLNRPEFSYDPDTDPLTGQYQKAYTREGRRATEDTMAQAAAMSGGIPSSYAVTAAAQAGNYYGAQMADKIPELYQLAYNKYLSDYNMKLNDLNAVKSAEESDYARYLNELNQYNTDRAFDYGVLLDEISSQNAERSEALDRAITAAEYGDYTGLQDLGINTENNPAEWEKKYNLALLAAEYGDYSGLQDLGIEPQMGDPKPKQSGSIPTDLIADLNSIYKDGVITGEADWSWLVENYGEDALAAAGFTYSPEETPIVKDNAYASAINEMTAAGVPMTYINGLPDREKFEARRHITGTDESEYTSYEAYLRDWVAYAMTFAPQGSFDGTGVHI